jgi:hypothetical protein
MSVANRPHTKRKSSELQNHIVVKKRKDGTGFCRKCRRRLLLVQSGGDSNNRQYRCPVAVDSYPYWRNRKKLTIDGRSFTRVDYARLYRKQRGLCAICLEPETMIQLGRLRILSVDHNHITDEARGLLCQRCNAMIGYSREDLEILKNAISYLKEHQR